jgi:hypothetical protein
MGVDERDCNYPYRASFLLLLETSEIVLADCGPYGYDPHFYYFVNIYLKLKRHSSENHYVSENH